MISLGTLYAFIVLAISAGVYLALHTWYGRGRGTAGSVSLIAFAVLSGFLLMASAITWLDAGVAFCGGVLGRWIFEPSHAESQSAHDERMRDAHATGDVLAVATLDNAIHQGSVNVVLSQMERRSDLTLHEANALDNKAGFVLGAASFLLLGVTGLQGVAASHSMDRGTVHIVQWLAVGSVLIYLGVVSAALRAYMVHEFVLAPEPITFHDTYMTMSEEHTKIMLARELLVAFVANQKIVEKKTLWTRRALRAFLAETVFLALILITIAITL